MRWPLLWHRRKSVPSADACAAVAQVGRALRDTEALAQQINQLASRAQAVAKRADEVRARNHIAEAVTRAIRGV